MSDLASFRVQSQTEKHGRSEDKKLFYCEVCEVPCATEFELKEHFKEEDHTKKERDLMYGGFKVEELERIIKKVKCLKDYVDEPAREPLIGLEYVVEFTNPGAAEPEYNCEMCGSKSKLVPMIVHLNGLKHRKAYISKYFPFSAKTRDPKEDIFQFLRRVALEIERFRGLKMLQDQDKNIEEDQHVAAILSKYKPLNPIVAKAVQRAKDRAAALHSNAENRDADPVAMQRAFETGNPRQHENVQHNEKNDLESQDGKNMGLKYSPLWGEDEWKDFFRGRSSAEKAAWLETFQKNQSTSKRPSDSGNSIQASSQKKEHVSGESQKETGRRAEAKRRDRRSELGQLETRAEAEKRERREEAERRERRADVEWYAENERRKRHAEAEKRWEAEKRIRAEYIAKAKSLTEFIAESKTATEQSPQRYIYVESNSTIVKVEEEKLVRAKMVAKRITKIDPNLPKPTVPSFIGKLRAFQNKPIRSAKGTDPSVKQVIAEKLAQTNRSQAGENMKGDVRQESFKQLDGQDSSVSKPKFLPLRQVHPAPVPVTAPSLSDESVARLLENFLKDSHVEDDGISATKDAVSSNQELSVQSRPPQFVTASGTSWNLYDVPTSSFESSLQNPLRFQTMEKPSSFFESQTNNSVRSLSFRDSCVLGNLTGTDGGFVSEYNGADKRSYTSIYGDAFSSYGPDYQGSSLYRNVSRASSNRMSDAASTDWSNLTSTSSTLQGFHENSLYTNYSGKPSNKLQGNADRRIWPSLGGSYKDGFGEMAQSRATAQKSTFHHW